MNKFLLWAMTMSLCTIGMESAQASGAFCYEHGNTRIGRVLDSRIIENYDGQETGGLVKGKRTYVFASRSKPSTWTGIYTLEVNGTEYGLFQMNLVTQDEAIASKLNMVMGDRSLALCHSGNDFQNRATHLPFPIIDGGAMEAQGFYSIAVENLSSPANQEDYPNKLYRVLSEVEIVRCRKGDGLIAYGLDTNHGIQAPEWVDGTLKAACGQL